jgi:membrane protein DedA with SNARE-associated domain
MATGNFCFAGGLAAVAWVSFYSLAAYTCGEAFRTMASSAAVSLACVAGFIMLAVPTAILRYEKRLLAKAELALPAARQLHTPEPLLREAA